MGKETALHPRSVSEKAILCYLWLASLLPRGFSAQPFLDYVSEWIGDILVRSEQNQNPKVTCSVLGWKILPNQNEARVFFLIHMKCLPPGLGAFAVIAVGSAAELRKGWSQAICHMSLVPTPRPGVHLFSRYLENATAVVSCVFFLIGLFPSSLRCWNFLELSFYPVGQKPVCPRSRVGIWCYELQKQTDWF